MNIAFNFYTSNSGGVIGTKKNIINALSCIAFKDKKNKYFIISDEETSKSMKASSLSFITKKPKNNLDKVLFYEYKANKVLKSFSIDVVINFGDIPIVTNINQVFYFDWPYAVYKDKEVWKRMTFIDRASKRAKLLYFKKNIKKVDHWIAQTELMKRKLNASFSIQNISIIDSGLAKDSSVQLNNNRGPEYNSDYLIYPTVYYPHKNIEVILPLAQLINNSDLNLKIILTISESDHRLSKKFIAKIKSENLDKIVIIKGRMDREELMVLIKKSKGIFMPTLIESYGLPYIEAQSLGVPIFTSDRDFSRELCKDSAFYFDPLNPENIFKCIVENINQINLIKDKLTKQEKIFKSKITWEEAVSQLILVAEN